MQILVDKPDKVEAPEVIWEPRSNGFIHQQVGVFPTIGGWAVHTNLYPDGDFDFVEPFLSVGKEERVYNKGKSPPFSYIERNREEMIEEAKKLALKWLLHVKVHAFERYRRSRHLVEHNKNMKRLHFIELSQRTVDVLEKQFPDFPEAFDLIERNGIV